MSSGNSPHNGSNDGPGASVPDVRQRLLDAAERRFALSGYRAASVRAITREARSNVASVNYYFGSKANLYREVFQRRLVDLRARRLDSIQRSLARAGAEASLELLLRAFTSAFLEPLVQEAAGRQWMELVAHELRDPQLPVGLFLDEMVDPLQETLVHALGQLCPGLSPSVAELCVQSLIGQLLHSVQMQRALRRAGRQCPSLDAVEQHIVRFSSAAIRQLVGPESDGSPSSTGGLEERS